MPSLVIRRGMKTGLQYRLDPGRPRIRLGRDATNQVQILDKKASREHAEIVFEDGEFVLRDKGSSNGTWLNSDRLEEEKALEDGDRIRIGGVILEFTDDVDDEIEDAEVIEEAEEIEGAEKAAEGEEEPPVEVSVEVEEAGAEDAADVEVLAEVEEKTDAKDSAEAEGSGEPGVGREERSERALAATQLEQLDADTGGEAAPEEKDDGGKGDDGQDHEPAETN
jgi:predicted component of type VI protein secretion system